MGGGRLGGILRKARSWYALGITAAGWDRRLIQPHKRCLEPCGLPRFARHESLRARREVLPRRIDVATIFVMTVDALPPSGPQDPFVKRKPTRYLALQRLARAQKRGEGLWRMRKSRRWLSS